MLGWLLGLLAVLKYLHGKYASYTRYGTSNTLAYLRGKAGKQACNLLISQVSGCGEVPAQKLEH